MFNNHGLVRELQAFPREQPNGKEPEGKLKNNRETREVKNDCPLYYLYNYDKVFPEATIWGRGGYY